MVRLSLNQNLNQNQIYPPLSIKSQPHLAIILTPKTKAPSRTHSKVGIQVGMEATTTLNHQSGFSTLLGKILSLAMAILIVVPSRILLTTKAVKTDTSSFASIVIGKVTSASLTARHGCTHKLALIDCKVTMAVTSLMIYR